MKTHILAPTKNVRRGLDCLRYLQARPVAHQVGLAMIYGRPGLGKTQFSMRYAIENNAVYLSALKASSPKSFVIELLRAVRAVYEPQNAEQIRGTKANLFRELLDSINLHTTKAHLPVIIVDEVDNILHYRHEDIVGMLRDIADNTVASVVLVGMQQLRDKIAKLNTHYYNRFIYFAEFRPIDNEDARLLCQQLSDITIADDLARFTNERGQANGDARKIIKAIRLYEEIAAKLGTKSLNLAEYQRIVK